MLRIFDTTMPVADPINFGADKGRHLLALLRDSYEGRCWKGAFIRRVTEVTKAGSINIERTNTSARGYVDVQFAAEVTVFSAWDILVGVTRSPAASEMVLGEYSARGARAIVSLAASKAAETLAIGQKFPARVIVAEHAPLRPTVSVVATLLTCDQSAVVFRLSGALEAAAAKAELAPLLERVEEELALRSTLDRARVRFHERLLYAFAEAKGDAGGDASVEAWPGGAVWEGPEGVKRAGLDAAPAVSVVDIVRRAVGGEAVDVTGTWSRSLDLFRSSPLARRAGAGKALPDGWAPPTDSVPRAVFAEFLKNVLDFLVCVREMVELYSTPELEKGSANLWTVMRAAQRRA